jgi:hypothetical protein
MSVPPAPAPSGARPGFASFKTSSAITYPGRWHRDALLQATLDPAIGSLAPFPHPELLPDSVSFAFLAAYEASPVAIGLSETEADHPTEVAGHPLVVLSRAAVLAEPRVSTARMVWAARRIPVAPGDRVRLLARLSEAGQDGLPLAGLEPLVRSSPCDPVDAVLALVAHGLLCLDVGRHLTHETVVWLREPPQPAHDNTPRAGR